MFARRRRRRRRKKNSGCSKRSHEWSMNREGRARKGVGSKRHGLLCFLRSRLLTPWPVFTNRPFFSRTTSWFPDGEILSRTHMHTHAHTHTHALPLSFQLSLENHKHDYETRARSSSGSERS